MAKEIERKFLVKDDSYKVLALKSVHIMQGYLSTDKRATVRVRMWEDERLTTGVTIDKTRYIVECGGFNWEVDEFHSPVSMTVAEIELPSSDQEFLKPSFVGEEVTGNPDYYNSNIAKMH